MKRLILTIICCLTIGLIPLFMGIIGVMDGGFTSDLVTQIIPLTMELKRMLASGEPLWSWNSFLGDNFIGSNNFYVLGNPFSLICALFPIKVIGFSFILCLYLQFILYGVTSYCYFRRMGFNGELAELGALMYSLSSFCIVNVFYFNFASAFILFPVFLITIENLIERRRQAFVILSLTAFGMVFTNFYFAALSFICGGIYAIVRSIHILGKNGWQMIYRFVLSTILGIAMAGIIFVPSIYSTLGTGRSQIGDIGGLNSVMAALYLKLYYFFIPRISEASENIYGSFSSFSFYIPCIGYILASAFCIRRRLSWIALVLGIFLIIWLTPLNMLFSFGVTQYYGRWGYAIILIAIMASLKAIKTDMKNTKVYVGYFVICFLTVILSVRTFLLRESAKGNCAELSGVWFLEMGLFVVGSIITLWCIYRKNGDVAYLRWGVIVIGVSNMLLCCFEYAVIKPNSLSLVINSTLPVKENTTFEHRIDVISTLNNHSYICNKPTVSTFHSVQNKELRDFTSFYREDWKPYFFVTHHRESFDALLSVKEVYRIKGTPLDNSKFIPCQGGRGYERYQNPFYIPMGFAYESFITENDFRRSAGNINYEYPERNNDFALGMMQHVVIKEEDVPRMSKCMSQVRKVDFNVSIDSICAERKKIVCSNFEGDGLGCRASIQNPGKERLFFFSFPNDKGFQAFIDGRKTDIYRANFGMTSILIKPGFHIIEFRYFTPGLMIGVTMSIVAFIILSIIYLYNRRKNLS